MGPLARVGAWSAVLATSAVLLLGGWAFSRGAAQPAQLRAKAQEQANAALSDAGFGWARLRISESVGVLTGEAPDEPSRAALEARARDLLSSYMGLPGVFLGLDNRVRVRPRLRADLLAELPAPGAGRSPSTSATPAACEAAFRAALGREGVVFRAGSFQLEPSARNLMRRIGPVVARCPGWRLVLEGHADGRGDSATNERLARRRASAVAAELLLQGVAVEQLETIAVVADVPAAQGGADSLALAASRKVAFQFIQTEAH